MNTKDDILGLEQELKACRKAHVAIGDETRQHIILLSMAASASDHDTEMLFLYHFRQL